MRALIHVAQQKQVLPRILEAVDLVNNAQKHVLFEKLHKHFDGQLRGRKIAIWGLSFKPRTDDIREAPSLVLINHLLEEGASIRVHDPVAQENVRAIYGERLTYCEQQYDALDQAEALCIVTEWNEFRNPNFALIRERMQAPVILDGRNLYSPDAMRELGFFYSGIGLGDDIHS